MKIRSKAEIIGEDGNIITKEIETEVPNVTEFGNPEMFYEVFDCFEKPVIEARNQINQELTEAFFEEAVKASKKGGTGNAKSKGKSDASQ